ncbi:HD domain-containing protein [Cytophagaceae bacterium ABcell3]|nr:HD domain-containing protein [Cytophagaceae bacterium ABcell3]
MNRKKIFNDPIYGFVTISDDLIFNIVEHPYFQRLRRIKQLGLTDFIYPGALHTRFHHALGAMHLMGLTLSHLRERGHDISDEEFVSAQIAILLHDIGHGPFSHTLESTILLGIKHERISMLIIDRLNEQFDGKLDMAVKMFSGKYERKFFHQLIASQLDIDRLDYLQRDCFFTGVSEGTIGADRIIKMLNVYNNEIVIEEKGIYSVENFLNSRRLMYWQVYLHKTTVSAEKMLVQIIKRARFLMRNNYPLYASEPLKFFLYNDISYHEFLSNESVLDSFLKLDDYDIWGAIKIWVSSEDRVLAELCSMLVNRRLFKIRLSNEEPGEKKIEEIASKIKTTFKIDDNEVDYFLLKGAVSNEAYMAGGEGINILMKDGRILDVAQASDLPNIKAISKIVKKHYLCYPKHLYL